MILIQCGSKMSGNKWILIYEIMFVIITLINVSIIVTDIILATADKSNDKYDIGKKVFSISSSICISLFSILATLNNIYDKTLSTCEMFKNFITNIIENFKNDEIVTKTSIVVKKVDSILTEYGRKNNRENKSITELKNFKNIVRKNLLYRLSIGNYIKLVTLVFFYFNAILFIIPIFNKSEGEIITKKVVTIFMNVVNQSLSVVFSYLSIVCNNMIFLNHICDLILDEIKKNNHDKNIIEFLEESSGFISSPLSVIWKKRTDLMKDKEDIFNKSMNTTIFGSPVTVISSK